MNPSRHIFASSTRAAKSAKSGAIYFRRPLAVAVLSPPSSFIHLAPPPPPIAARLADSDESLFRYTSGRWLYNESQQMAQRYIKFDVGALHRVIANVCGASVISMEKKEGLFNKSFIVTLTNGKQIAARIKNPIAGPDHLMTASEVATMDYARNYLGLPVPKVLAWSSRAATNDVGAEFILMEMAPGVPLSSVWNSLDMRRRKNVVNSLVSVEQNLLKAKFSMYGSLYYKDDVPEAQRSTTLYADGVHNASAEAKFCIGPMASRAFYEDERGELDINRGPWSSPEEYLTSVALREEAWIARHAKPNIHDDPFRSVVGPQAQDEHLDVLRQYRSVVPALVPKSKKVLSSILWHPDLNPGNIFVSDDDERRVVSIIDWQGCWSGPAYLQMSTPAFIESGADVPSGLEFPKLPENFDDMSMSSKAVVQGEHKAMMLQKLYEIKQLYPYRIPRRDTCVMPVRTAGRTWKDGILPLRLALLNVAASWGALSTPEQPCPLRITRDEVKSLTRQRDRYLEWHAFLDDLRGTFGMRLYGWVAPNEYMSKRALLERTRQQLPAALTQEMEEIMPRQWWPFRDTV
ncbi:hypothetical protein PLICRDRAFT_28199 [Plicaturopsis crispa FD-325 SS-3]|nr:hypothetical protein PLICRDRAFT_28199 [Plicaturopsis crispa FD-325 SS-3]